MSNFDETFDFVVVGSGGGSMCCALALRAGGKSVVVLEKTPLIGGTTSRSGGVMWIPENRFMKRDGIPDSQAQANTYLDAIVGDHNDTPGATRARRETYVAEGAQMVEFLIDQGIKLNRVSYWPDYNDEKPGGSEKGRTVIAELFNVNELGAWKNKLRPNFIPMMSTLDEMLKMRFLKSSWEARRIAVRYGLRTIFAKLTGKNYVTAGAALQGRMFQAALKAGVEFRTECAVTELVIENGKVTGVVATLDGKPRRFGTNLGVLVNAGGFAHNQKMRDQYQPGASAKWTNAAEGDTGEMILEMMRHGAAIAQMEEMVGNQMSIPPGMENEAIKPVVQGLTASPHAILVDQTGLRYMNEGGSYMTYCQGMLARNKTVPAVPSHAIIDSQYMKRYGLITSPFPSRNQPQEWYDKGFLKKADTIEELAVQLSIDPATLRATVDRFNAFVAKNHDDDFNRGDRAYDRWLGDIYHPKNASLGSISEGPFYSVPVVPGDVGTYGGVVTDTEARVLREDGTPIEGLYATGVSTASVFGRSYAGAGASVGPSFVWGYVTAKSVLAKA